MDVSITRDNAYYLVTPLTDFANKWIRLNTPPDSRQYFGDALFVEDRHISDLVAGMRESGLEVGSNDCKI